MKPIVVDPVETLSTCAFLCLLVCRLTARYLS